MCTALGTFPPAGASKASAGRRPTLRRLSDAPDATFRHQPTLKSDTAAGHFRSMCGHFRRWGRAAPFPLSDGQPAVTPAGDRTP